MKRFRAPLWLIETVCVGVGAVGVAMWSIPAALVTVGVVGSLRVLLAGPVRWFVAAVQRRGESWLGQHLGERVIVNTTDDQTFEGSLMSTASDGVLLKAARLIGDDKIQLAGDVFVPKPKIIMIQRPTDDDA